MLTILRTSIWCLAILVVLMAGAVTYLRIADLSIYKELIEGILSEAIGHELVVDGLFELNFGGTTQLTAEKVSLSNIDWQPDPVIAIVDRLSVRVDLWSLVSGPIVVEELTFNGVRVRLEKNEVAQANWATESSRDDSRSQSPLNRDLIAFHDVQIQDVRIVYLNPARRQPINLKLEHLTIIPDESRVLDLDLSGTINEIPIWADGKLGPWENLLDGQDIIADLDMMLGQVRITLDGAVENLSKLIGTELSLSISGPAIEHITDRLGLPPFADGRFIVDGRILKLDVGSQLRVEGNLGAIEIFASGNIDSLLDPDNVKLDFNFSGPNVQYVAEVFGINGALPEPFLIAGNVSKKQTRLTFSGTRAQVGENILGFDGWLDFKVGVPDGDLIVNASGPDFSVVGPFGGVSGLPAEAFEIGGRMRKMGASLRFDEMEAIVGANRISANGAIGERGSPDTQISFNASGPDVSILGPITGLEGIKARPFDVSAIVKPAKFGIEIENAVGDFGEIQIEVDGVVGTSNGLVGTDLGLHAEGLDLRHVALLTGIPFLPDGPFSIGARARINENELRLSEVTANVGGMSGTVSGSVSLGANAGQFDLDLSVSGPDLAEAGQFDWLDRMSGEAFMLDGHLERQSGEYELNSISAVISDLEISVDGDLSIADATGDIVLRASAPDADELRRLIGVAYLPDGAVSVSGRIEKQENELRFSDVIASIGEYSMGADGTLSNAPLSNRSDLRFSGSGPELHEVGLIFDYDDLPARTFSFSGEVNGIPTGYTLEGLVARIGDNDIVGGFTANLRDKPEIVGNLTSSFLDLRRRLEREDVETAEDDTGSREFLVSDKPLNAAWLDAANIDITVKTDRLILEHGDVQDFQIGVTLWDGVLNIDPVSFRESDGMVVGKLELAPENGTYELNAFLNIENMHVGLMASQDQDRSTVPPVDGQMELKGTGRSLHEIMASSNGNISLTQGKGRLKDLITSQLFGDLVLQIIRTLNPLQTAAEYTTLQCANYVVIVENGLATIEKFVMQSERMAFIAKGTVNFADEKLNLAMRATPREGLGISIGGVANSFFKLGGTLREPKLQIDPTASVATTGAAVVTGGLSIVAKGLWDRVRAQSDTCKDREKENNSQ